jgi:AmpD protein
MGPVDASGWVRGIERVVSPFFDARPASSAVDLVVIHNISLPPGRFGGGAHPFYARLAGVRVSAHFFIDRAGDAIQFVSTADRAWHAGVSRFEGRSNCNDFSIGIELEGTDFTPFAAAQYATLACLLRILCAALPLRAVRGHSDIALERKTDPGPFFEWARLRAHARLDASLFPAPTRA